MPYQIRKTDGSTLINLDDGIVNKNVTSIALIGKNVSAFGKDQNENFVRLLENFSSSVQPSNSIKGQLWFNITNDQIFVKTSSGFQSLGPFAEVETAPITNTGTNVYATAAFVHSLIPKGVILMWGGLLANIPSGWALCDGSTVNGVQTPNLQNKFVMAAGDNYQPHDNGGVSSINQVIAHNHSFDTETSSNNVDHTHSGITSGQGNHNHVFPGDDQLTFANGRGGWSAQSVDGFPYDARSVAGGGGTMWRTTDAGSHNHSFNTGFSSNVHIHTVIGQTNTTGTASINIINPYYALAFIMKVI